MSEYLEAIRPVLFENEDTEYAYSGRGSSFLLASSQNQYWVTAEHVIKNQNRVPEDIRIFPQHSSRISLPFDQALRISTDGFDTDWGDLCILKIDAKAFAESGDARMVGQAVPEGLISAACLLEGEPLRVIGYPDEGRDIDYESYVVRYKLQKVNARYVGASSGAHVHELELHRDHGLSTFQGLSGSPVVVYKRVEKYILPLICGVFLRATIESRQGHFVDANVLCSAVATAEG